MCQGPHGLLQLMDVTDVPDTYPNISCSARNPDPGPPNLTFPVTTVISGVSERISETGLFVGRKPQDRQEGHLKARRVGVWTRNNRNKPPF